MELQIHYRTLVVQSLSFMNVSDIDPTLGIYSPIHAWIKVNLC